MSIEFWIGLLVGVALLFVPYFVKAMPWYVAIAGFALCISIAIWLGMPESYRPPVLSCVLYSVSLTAGVFGGGYHLNEVATANKSPETSSSPAALPARIGGALVTTETNVKAAAQAAPAVGLGMKVTRHARAETPAPAPMSRGSVTGKLRSFAVDAASLENLAANAQNEEQVEDAARRIQASETKMANWIRANMGGEFAVQKFRTSGNLYFADAPWHGSPTDDAGVMKRSQFMSMMRARRANLQDMIAAPTWDKE